MDTDIASIDRAKLNAEEGFDSEEAEAWNRWGAADVDKAP